jgi:thymidylate synthase
MHVINAVNVRDALPIAVKYLMHHGEKTQTRNGNALVAPIPVAIRYINPKQHVLINPVRDANPFFHLMEAMWMLAGRDDGAFLDHYIKDFSKKFGTNGRIMDAYGQRWRVGAGFDQLNEIVQQLQCDPYSRQCVLQMWGAGREDLLVNTAKPCNIAATFRIRNNKLDMFVFNRSNDLIWGCCGANAVHFPILQEYISGRLKIEMGEYWQISTNLHLYDEHHKILLDRTGETNLFVALKTSNGYESTLPLMSDHLHFDEDLNDTMDYIDAMHNHKEGYIGNISNLFLREVVIPMATAHWMYKAKNWEEAFEAIDAVKAEDWRRAGEEWLKRRLI